MSYPMLEHCTAVPSGSLKLGSRVTIDGECRHDVSDSVDSFRVDFLMSLCEHSGHWGDKEIAFHFNPRLGQGPYGQGVVVMNSYANGRWEKEFQHYPESLPLGPGRPFRLEFAVVLEGFRVTLDGQYLCEFAHRYSFNSIGRIHVTGRLEVRNVQVCEPNGRLERTIRSPAVPFFEHEPGLAEPCDIYMEGTILSPCTEFVSINLGNTEGRPASAKLQNIPIHISLRPNEGAVVRNSLTYGSWGEEERELQLGWPLQPGSRFDLMLANRADKLSVAINGQLAFEFRHRHNPRTIDCLQITGSGHLEYVRMKAVSSYY